MTRTSVTPNPTAQAAAPQTQPPMTPTQLVTSIGVTLTQLDQVLMEPDLVNQPSQWQQVYAMRKHLDDQQRALVAATIQADDPAFQALTGKIQLAIQQLQATIEDLKKVDSIVNAIGQVSTCLDEILKAVA